MFSKRMNIFVRVLIFSESLQCLFGFFLRFHFSIHKSLNHSTFPPGCCLCSLLLQGIGTSGMGYGDFRLEAEVPPQCRIGAADPIGSLAVMGRGEGERKSIPWWKEEANEGGRRKWRQKRGIKLLVWRSSTNTTLTLGTTNVKASHECTTPAMLYENHRRKLLSQRKNNTNQKKILMLVSLGL